jgi:hypothetical protein
VLYLGGHIINGGIREFMGDEAYDKMKAETRNSFKKSDIPAVIRFLDTHFGDHNYTLWHLFKDERKKVFDQILESSMEDIQVFFRQIFENDYTTIQAMREMQLSLPKALATPVEFVLNTDLQNILESESIDLTRLKNLVAEFKKMNVTVEKSIQSLRASNRITKMMKKLAVKSDDADLIRNIEDILAVLQPLDLDIDLWETQNIYFILGKKHFGNMKKKAKQGDKKAKNWVDHFTNLGAQLRVKVD